MPSCSDSRQGKKERLELETRTRTNLINYRSVIDWFILFLSCLVCVVVFACRGLCSLLTHGWSRTVVAFNQFVGLLLIFDLARLIIGSRNSWNPKVSQLARPHSTYIYSMFRPSPIFVSSHYFASRTKDFMSCHLMEMLQLVMFLDQVLLLLLLLLPPPPPPPPPPSSSELKLFIDVPRIGAAKFFKLEELNLMTQWRQVSFSVSSSKSCCSGVAVSLSRLSLNGRNLLGWTCQSNWSGGSSVVPPPHVSGQVPASHFEWKPSVGTDFMLLVNWNV